MSRLPSPPTDIFGLDHPIMVHAPEGMQISNTMAGVAELLRNVHRLVCQAAVDIENSDGPGSQKKVRDLYLTLPLLDLAIAYVAATETETLHLEPLPRIPAGAA